MDNNSFIKILNSELEGDVKSDYFTRNSYSIDASIYQIMPVAVAYPRNISDVKIIVDIAHQSGIPVIARGAGTGIAGGCLGNGIIVDFSKFMNRILAIDYEQEYVICEPGVVQNQLNHALASKGYRLGPDTSTGNRATIGGMLANNASGSHSLRYGKMVDNVLSVEVILATGLQWQCNPFPISDLETQQLQKIDTQMQLIYQLLAKFRMQLSDEITDRFPKINRRVSGYNLDTIITDDHINLSTLMAGSEGTLGITTNIKMKICLGPIATGIAMIHCCDLIAGLNIIDSILEFNPYAVEMIDDIIVKSGRQNPIIGSDLSWLEGPTPPSLLLVEFSGDSISEVTNKLEKFQQAMRKQTAVHRCDITTDSRLLVNIWKLREAGLGLLMARRTNERAIAFLEDIAIPPQQLGKFLQEFRNYIKDAGKEAGFYGHAGAGCIHVRPMLDLHRRVDVDLMIKMMNDISDLTLQYGGAVSGEHGDGLIRSWLIPKMFGDKIYQAFNELKQAFDPRNLMNPGKIVAGQQPDQNLKVQSNSIAVDYATFLDFNPEGGLLFAVDMCNGNGECRKTIEGVMCPSFQVTLDERDTTRARAHALQSVLNGRLNTINLADQELHDILDLCLECKGCKNECPSQVDMAKIKSEVLYHYHKKNGHPLRNRLFAYIHKVNHMGCATAPFSNYIFKSKLSHLFLRMLGITDQRPLIPFARNRFSQSSRYRKQYRDQGKITYKVILFIDTFTEFNYPEIGHAAAKILDVIPCEYIMCFVGCCGRPMYAKGMLDQAKLHAAKIVNQLIPYVRSGYYILGLEPSCILTMKDEYPSLLRTQEASEVAAVCFTIDKFFIECVGSLRIAPFFRKRVMKALIHRHCHQKASEGMVDLKDFLHMVLGIESSEINAGCCGMAGAFGYEIEHYDFSLKIAESRLFPVLRSANPNILIIANGISCRQQIRHGLGRTPKHLVEVMAEHLI